MPNSRSWSDVLAWPGRRFPGGGRGFPKRFHAGRLQITANSGKVGDVLTRPKAGSNNQYRVRIPVGTPRFSLKKNEKQLDTQPGFDQTLA
mgnify:CR=1 FL=1